MLLTCEEMQASEAALFASGKEAEPLMNLAGERIANVICRLAPQCRTAILFVGKGHNGGDALVAGRHLATAGWKVYTRYVLPPKECAALTRKKADELGALALPWDGEHSRNAVVVDGLLGIGAKGPLRPEYRQAAKEINALRNDFSPVFAIDLPSGLDGDSGVPHEDCVRATHTLAIAHGKRGLVADTATAVVGRIEVIRLEIPPLGGIAGELVRPEIFRSWLSPRPVEMHKGDAGRIGIIAGSPGLMGAAELAAHAALRSGGGLVTLLVPEAIQPHLASRVPVEIMVRGISDWHEVSGMRFDALGVGPGLGDRLPEALRELIWKDPRPMVLDADALNYVANEPMEGFGGPRLLTPHPGEMARLQKAFGTSKATRLEQAQSLADRLNVVVLLKGARSVITDSEQIPFYNTTGHSGMASGGMGDVLTGVATTFLAQGHSPLRSGSLAAWLCGRSAEIALERGESEESLIASDVIGNLGRAFQECLSLA